MTLLAELEATCLKRSYASKASAEREARATHRQQRRACLSCRAGAVAEPYDCDVGERPGHVHWHWGHRAKGLCW